MKRHKKIWLVMLSLIGLFIIFSIWYKYHFEMDEARSYEVNSIDFPKKVLIATQGSDFKNNLTQEIVGYYMADSVYFKVIDISSLIDTDLEVFNGVLILHTWEYSKPPRLIQTFMDNGSYNPKNMIVFTTSGEGSQKMTNIDALTGASKMKNIRSHLDEIVMTLNPIINYSN